MLNKTFFILAIIIVWSCERTHYIDDVEITGGEITYPNRSDNFNISGTDKFLGFNSYELFDTSYFSYYGNMCSSPTEYFTFSNSDYLCQDTFDILERFSIADTMLLLKFGQEPIHDSIKLDQAFISQKIKVTILNYKSSAASIEIIFDTIQVVNNIKFAYYAYTDSSKNEITQSGLTAYAIIDNVLVSILLKTYKRNSGNMLEKFKDILNTFTILDI